MNTHVDMARITRHTNATHGSRSGSLRTLARSLAAWWSADPMSASFAAAREHDQRVHQRIAGR
jgi:hypothetical protein